MQIFIKKNKTKTNVQLKKFIIVNLLQERKKTLRELQKINSDITADLIKVTLIIFKE